MADVKWEELADGVVAVVLDNPPLNLLSTDMKEKLLLRAGELRSRWPTVRAVVLKGAGGRAFSAGADLREFPERIQRGTAKEAAAFGHQLLQAWRSLPQVTIAAVGGWCLGAGAEVALYCDFRIFAENVRYGFPEVQRGWFPGNGGTQLLARLVGWQKARRLLLTGDPVTAGEALILGLADAVVADHQLDSEALHWASRFAARPACAVASLKRLLEDPTLDEGLAREAELFAAVFATADAQEGVAAFFEKRQPSFGHR